MLSNILSVLISASTFVPVSSQQLTQPDTGQVTLDLGTLSEPLQGDLNVAARAWALSQRERYSLPLTSSLRSAEAMGTRFGASFHLLQTVKDVEVYGGKLVVTVDERARVVQVASSLEQYSRVLDTWLMTPEEAMKRAAAPIPLPALRPDGVPFGGAKKYLFRVGDELHAGYLTNVKSLDFSRNWYVAVDAVTGERIFTQDRVHRALDAQVYPVSPGGLDAGVGATPTVARQLVHADGGSMVGNECAALMLDGGMEYSANDAGYLCGTQLMSYNCCPSADCVPDAGPRRVSGMTNFMGVPVTYDVAVCDRVRRASSVTNPSGNYVYAPVDPPVNKMVVESTDRSNSDEFAEVHSFYHVNRVYDWMRRLSTKARPIFPAQNIQPFMMRDERRVPAQKVAVWSNVMFPNFNELISGGVTCLLNPPCRANTLLRMDNAAFFPRENFSQIPIAGFDTGVDTLMIFQGNAADAAYDATVIQHEFGHGAVYATANISFETIAIDTRSANNEGGALHEGFADYIAAAFNNEADVGPYFGPRALAGQPAAPGVRQNSYLRTMDNTFTCPDVLWGEVHQDSQHVAAALWKARQTVFLGTDQGDTFDAAFYAMLVGITPNADFAMVASVMAERVATAFPSIATARAQMTQIFTDKGVIGCSKVLDVTAAVDPRPYYGIPSSSSMSQSVIPGPYQFKISAPNGAARVRVTGTAGSQNPLGGPGPAIQVLTRVGSPITFARQGGTLVNDATRSVTGATASNGAFTASVDGFVPCNSDIYVTLGAAGGGGTLQAVRVIVDPASSCTPAPDGGTTDGGTDAGTTADAGITETKSFPYVGSSGTIQQPAAKSCGCSTPADFAPLAMLLLLGVRRRKAR